MNVQILQRDSDQVAYLRYTGPYGPAVSDFWQTVYVPWAIANKLGPRQARYGISLDDPGSTPPEQCRYDACAQVGPDFQANSGAQKAIIPGGMYAVFKFKGTGAEIGLAWSKFFTQWLPSSGMNLDSRPCFEYYPKDAAYDSETQAFECELCIPVKPHP